MCCLLLVMRFQNARGTLLGGAGALLDIFVFTVIRI